MVSELHFEDHLKSLPDYTDKLFGLGLVDGPYGLKEDGRRNSSRYGIRAPQKDGSKKIVKANQYETGNWDNEPLSAESAELIRSKCKNVIIWGGNYYSWLQPVFKTPRRHELEDFIAQNPTGWIIWDKCNGESDFNDFELAWHSFGTPTQVIRYMWAGHMQGKSLSEGHIMQGDKRLNEKRIHPCQKPVILYKWLLKEFAQPGDIILDPCAGSGSSLIACEDMGFEYVAFENNENIYQKASQRLRNHKRQYSLFV